MKKRIDILELQFGRRRRDVIKVRVLIVGRLVEKYRISLAEIARHAVVSAPAIVRILKRIIE